MSSEVMNCLGDNYPKVTLLTLKDDFFLPLYTNLVIKMYLLKQGPHDILYLFLGQVSVQFIFYFHKHFA